MIAAMKARPGALCIVRETKREGLRVLSHSYCTLTTNAGDGVLQVPEKAIDCQPCKDAVLAEHGTAFDS